MAMAVDDTAEVEARMQERTSQSVKSTEALEQHIQDMRRQLVSCEANIEGISMHLTISVRIHTLSLPLACVFGFCSSYYSFRYCFRPG